MGFEDGCYRLAWSGFNEEDIFPSKRPHLAHYTSISVLESILKNEELWLSHPLLMNDHQELAWGMREGREIFLTSSELRVACQTKERFERLSLDFINLYDKYESDEAKEIYVTCFSEHDMGDSDGLLSMWRGYGSNGGGVAVVFDTSKLTPIDESPFVLAPVSYECDESRLGQLRGLVGSFADLIRQHGPTDDDLWYVAGNYFERLKIFSLFTKHRGFSEEREWRLVYLRDRDGSGKMSDLVSYSIGDDAISPKMKVPFSRIGDPSFGYSFDKLVSKIVVGPKSTGALSVMAIRKMMECCGKSVVSSFLVESSTPFRG